MFPSPDFPSVHSNLALFENLPKRPKTASLYNDRKILSEDGCCRGSTVVIFNGVYQITPSYLLFDRPEHDRRQWNLYGCSLLNNKGNITDRGGYWQSPIAGNKCVYTFCRLCWTSSNTMLLARNYAGDVASCSYLDFKSFTLHHVTDLYEQLIFFQAFSP